MNVLKQLYFRTDPEFMHHLVLAAGRVGGLPLIREAVGWYSNYEADSLETYVLGMHFKNPVGLAAGYDKNGVLLDLWPYLGFGFVEVGSVTAGGGKGNKGKRIWRLPADLAVANRMGLNNDGAYMVCERVAAARKSVPVGMNIAKTNNKDISGVAAINDYAYSFEECYAVADYVVVNVSCPNTEDGRTFEEPRSLDALLSFLIGKKKLEKPVLLKLSPDNSYERLDEIIEVCEKYGVDGYVISNTTKSRSGLRTERAILDCIGGAGISGRPLKERNLGIVAHIYRATKGKRPIIGCGGIFNGSDAFDYIVSGASLVEVLTGFIYEFPNHGFRVVSNINRGLEEQLRNHGFSCVRDAVGVAV